MKRRPILALLALAALAFLPGPGRADETGPGKSGSLPVDYQNFLSRNDIVLLSPDRHAWDGLPLGNGRIGARTWQPDELMFQLNARGGALTLVRLAVGAEPGLRSGLEEYSQRLSLYDATVTTRSRHADGQLEIRAWMAATTDALVVQVNDNRAGAATHYVDVEAWRPGVEVITGPDYVLLREKAGEIAWALRISIPGGRVTSRSESPRVVRIATNTRQTEITALYVEAEPEADASARAEQAAESFTKRGISGFRREHCQWWSDFWSKSVLNLHSADGLADYLENLWYIHLYCLGSGMRGELPMNFENGLWHSQRDIRGWGPGYWHWNEQVAVWPLFAANHLELHESYRNLFRRLLPGYQAWTQSYFGTQDPEAVNFLEVVRSSAPGPYRGPKEASDHPTLHVPKNRGNLILSSSLETAMQFWWAYLYTGDEAYLRNQAYPMMKATALFFLEYLYRDGTGRYVMDPSDAHETFERVRNPVNDLAGIRYVFPAVIETAELLGVDTGLQARCREVLDNLAPYPIDPGTGALLPYELRPGQKLMTEMGHTGHCPSQHVYGVFPLMTLGSTDHGLAVRSFHEHLKKHTNQYGWVVDSLCAARLGLAEELKNLLTDHVRRFQHYRCGLMSYLPVFLKTPFYYFDGSGPVATALNEMLLQGWNGVIRVCPALPEDWEAKFTLLTPGGFLISGQAAGGQVKYLSILSQRGETAAVANPFGRPAAVNDGRRVILRSAAPELKFPTEAGREYRIYPADQNEPRPSMVTGETNQGPKTFPESSRRLGKSSFEIPELAGRLEKRPAGRDFEPDWTQALKVARTAGPVRIDGRLTEACWRGAPAGTLRLAGGRRPGQRTDVWLAADDQALYVAAEAREDRMKMVQAERGVPGDPLEPRVALDDSLALIMEPMPGAQWRLRVNPLGVQNDSLFVAGVRPPLEERLSLMDPEWESSIRTTEDGWIMEARLEYARFAPFPPGTGQTWRFGVERNEYPHGERTAWPSETTGGAKELARLELPAREAKAAVIEPQPDLQLHWKLEAVDGPWVLDASGHARHGYFSGARSGRETPDSVLRFAGGTPDEKLKFNAG
ncbi:MAG TPA: DUF5703 domain-containing protein [bacterium]|nr:DUF5703 domain-containing protein [bacterium]